MAPNTTFESLNFHSLIFNDSPNDNSQGPDVNSFHDNVSPLDTDYILLSGEIHQKFIVSSISQYQESK